MLYSCGVQGQWFMDKIDKMISNIICLCTKMKKALYIYINSTVSIKRTGHTHFQSHLTSKRTVSIISIGFKNL